jgi:hypothetical protein
MLLRLLSKKGLTGFFCLLAGVGVLWWLLVPKEPSYQGKTLTEWQDVLMSDMSSVRVFRDYGAVQLTYARKHETPFKSMGTNMFPFLLNQIQAKDSEFEIWYREKCQDYGWQIRFFRWEGYDREAAALSFLALQEEAHSAAPQLLALSQEGNSEVKWLIFRTLSLMGFNSEEYLRFLINDLRSKAPYDQDCAIDCLMRLGPKAKSVLSELQMLSNSGGQPAKAALELKQVIHRVSSE